MAMAFSLYVFFSYKLWKHVIEFHDQIMPRFLITARHGARTVLAWHAGCNQATPVAPVCWMQEIGAFQPQLETTLAPHKKPNAPVATTGSNG